MNAPELILVRHARHLTAHEATFDGNQDYPLSDATVEESLRIAEWLRSVLPTIDGVYASPLSRAHACASIISDLFQAGEPIVIPQAHEVNMGSLQGTAMVDARLKFPELRELPRQELIDFGLYGGESTQEIQIRVQATLRELDSAYAAGATRLLLVTHGVFGSHLIKSLLSGPQSASCGVYLSSRSASLLRFHPGFPAPAQLIFHANEYVIDAARPPLES